MLLRAPLKYEARSTASPLKKPGASMPGTATMEPGRVGFVVPGPVKLPRPTVLTRRDRRVYWFVGVLFVRRATVYLSL